MKKNMIAASGCCVGLLASTVAFGQTAEERAVIRSQMNVDALTELAAQFSEKYRANKAEAVEMAKKKGWPLIESLSGGGIRELQGIMENGTPIYYRTYNLDAAKTISTNKVWPSGSSGLSLDGTGMILGEWDDWGVRTTHQEFQSGTAASRVTQQDVPICKNATKTYPDCTEPPEPNSGSHATHVAGTLIAEGVDAQAQGMAYKAQLHAYDWTDDFTEMAAFADSSGLVSNHSYGWDREKWSTEDTALYTGVYEEQAHNLDVILYNAPNYLPVFAAGNDQATCKEKLASKNGYDCIAGPTGAKNILTVGAIDDMPNGYSSPSDAKMTNFSNWGPMDDGRIKPDICGNGYKLYSTNNTGDSEYITYSGTSMATPNVAGSLILLQQHYNNVYGSPNYMLAATLKALAIHTADEFGSNAGPDYQCGWGVMNTANAADMITKAKADQEGNADRYQILEEEYSGTAKQYTVTIPAPPAEKLGMVKLKATLVWTDPAPATLPDATNVDPDTKVLVNDLNLTVSDGTTTWQPYKLDKSNPAAAATTGVNDVDNVEQVVVSDSGIPREKTYTITVAAPSGAASFTQKFSLLISAASSDENSSKGKSLQPMLELLL